MPSDTRSKIIGTSGAILGAIDIAIRVAPYNCPVLIVGETGTGKDLFANLIHEHSPWRSGPFVPVNCAALTEGLADSVLFGHRDGAFTGSKGEQKGLITEAHNGTLFLDEVGEMSETVQCKLLRVAQDGVVRPIGGQPRHVNFRLVAATNANLSSGKLRQDLLFRFGARLEVPPLRERTEDIEAIVRHVIDDLGATPHWQVADVLPALKRMTWSGNVRQLINSVRYSVMVGGEIGANEAQSKPLAITYPCKLPNALKAYEAHLVSGALDISGGNVAGASRLLGINRTTLVEKISALSRMGFDFVARDGAKGTQ